MNYCNIKNNDIANGAGLRVTLFVSGCTNHCEGCFQPETWSFSYGEAFTEETQARLMEMLSQAHIQGLSLLGGDPFEPENQRALLPFLRRLKQDLPSKDIWAWSGFLYEDMKREGSYVRCEATDEMLSLVDILVDGPFILEKKNLMLRFRGSSNQRVLDMKETLSRGEAVLSHYGQRD